MLLHLVLILAQAVGDSVPPPRGFVNDFAGVVDPAAAARMEYTLRQVQSLTHGDIAVVTLADLHGRPASDVALRIGREWKVGGSGAPGEAARNLGVVLLLVPRQNHQPGTGDLFIATGRGAEGFLPDARVGRIRDAMLPALAQEDYSGALETGVSLLAQAFAAEFQVTLPESAQAVSAPPVGAPAAPPVPGVVSIFLVVLLIVVVVSLARGVGGGRRRGGLLPWLLIGGWGGGGWRRGGWGGGGGGFGGFGGGGFGGFGGGGGFSGGGAGGKF